MYSKASDIQAVRDDLILSVSGSRKGSESLSGPQLREMRALLNKSSDWGIALLELQVQVN